MSSIGLQTSAIAQESRAAEAKASPVAPIEQAVHDGQRPEMMRWTLIVALLASVLFWIVAWHWETAASMATIWWRSDTFAHGMVVYPISLWLIWGRRSVLRRLPVRSALWVLIPLAIASFGWLLAELGGVQAGRHFFLVVMIALAVWAVTGTRITKAIAFPLAFTLLAVPVGEFLLPILMEHTADFTVGALRITGVPVYREGNDFIVPSGSWSVVEACSGLRYLIASVTLGLLYAYLSYTSLLRRSMFVLVSVLVPIVANWVRAYMIVMIGHLSGMKYAVGVDHLIYGWLFFGVVMLILFWIGARWRQDTDMGIAPVHNTVSATWEPSPSMAIGAVLAAAVVTVAPTYAAYLEAREANPTLSVSLPVSSNGWVAAKAGSPLFRPHFVGARTTLEQVFERDGQRVGLYVAYFSQERQGSELISFQNSLVSTRDRSWTQIAQIRLPASQDGLAVVQTRLRSGTREFLVWHHYWAGARWTTQPQVVKVRQAVDKLMGRGDDAAVVVIFTKSESAGDAANTLLRSFYEDMGPGIEAALNQTRRASSSGRTGSSLVTHGSSEQDRMKPSR